ncbi:MAG: peptidylprolyl isomerase [Sulfuricurvum sp. PC08-66]|nr:MAG: peptidylprolyl isomerase [Sulfuricurvum sp. PC08-66]
MAITANQIVSIEYEVKDTQTNTVVDSNIGGAPLTFMMGRNQIIIGLENGIKNMNKGDKADVLVKAADAYGEYDNEALQELPIEQFAGIELAEGMALYGQGEHGETVQVTVKSFDNEKCTIDFNHPLAGKDLMFTVAITALRDATPDEALSGIPAENAVASGGSCGTGCGCH